MTAVLDSPSGPLGRSTVRVLLIDFDTSTRYVVTCTVTRSNETRFVMPESRAKAYCHDESDALDRRHYTCGLGPGPYRKLSNSLEIQLLGRV